MRFAIGGNKNWISLTGKMVEPDPETRLKARVGPGPFQQSLEVVLDEGKDVLRHLHSESTRRGHISSKCELKCCKNTCALMHAHMLWSFMLVFEV